MVENQQGEAIALVWLFPAISTILVALRVYSRYLGRNFGWDDGMALVSFVLLIMEAVCTHEMTMWGHYGYHIYDLPPQSIHQRITTLQWSFSLQLIYHPLMGSIRASIVLFLYRVGDMRRRIQYALHAVFWLNVGYTISTFTANVLTCNPVRYSWLKPIMDTVDANGKTIPGGKCFPTLDFVLASCALSIFMDLIIMPIPTMMVWNLKMAKKTKMIVIFVTSLGWIATAMSCVRFVVYYHRWQPNFTDRNYNIGFVVSIVEANVGFWAACAPALNCFIRHALPRWFNSQFNSSKRNESYPHQMKNVRSNSRSDGKSGERGIESENSAGARKGDSKRSEDMLYRIHDLDIDNDADTQSEIHIVSADAVHASSKGSEVANSESGETDDDCKSRRSLFHHDTSYV